MVMCLLLLSSLFPFFDIHSNNDKLVSFLSLLFPFSTGFDLKLPLDEFGAVDFDFVQTSLVIF
jgi:hypothetical protein